MPGVGFSRLRSPRNDLLLAAVWFVAGTAFYLTGLQELLSGFDAGVPRWRWLAVLAVGCVAVLLRRPAPLVALGLAGLVVIVDWLHGPSLPVVLVPAAVLYSATLHGSLRLHQAMIAGAVLAAVTITVGSSVLDGDWRVGLLVILEAGVILLVPVWWATELRQRRERVEIARRGTAQQARIAELDHRAAAAAERTRMAHELQDGIAGHLSGIALQAAAGLALAEDDPAAIRTVLRTVRGSSVQALVEMQEMIDLLNIDLLNIDARNAAGPGPHAAPARLADLERLLDSARAAGLEVTVRTDLTGGQLPAAVDLTAFRIVQEALTNAVRYAAGSRTNVTVCRDGAAVVVEVTNDLTSSLTSDLVGTAGNVPATTERSTPQPVTTGNGAASQAAASQAAAGQAPVGDGAVPGTAPVGIDNGLLSMRDRALALGGTLTAGRTAGRWQVRAVLPLGVTEG